MNNDIYLEISGRRSGKTERVKKEYYKNPTNSYVVVPSVIYGECIYPEDIKCITIEDLASTERGTTFKSSFNESRLLWDEFDLGDDGTKYIKSGDYYVCTPMKFRTANEFSSWMDGTVPDMLLTLVARCHHTYEKHRHGDIGNLREVLDCMPTSKYIAEMHGEFECTFEQFIKAGIPV